MGVITVCSPLGSRADTLALQLAERLDYRYLDRTALRRELVRRNGGPIPPVAQREVDELAPSLFDRLEGDNCRRYFLALRAIILEWADQGDVVVNIVAAAPILREIPHVLRVLASAPAATRARRVAAHEEVALEVAADRVRRSDSQRARFVRHYFSIDWLDARHYHLVVDTENGATDDASDQVLRLLSEECEPNSRTIQLLENLALSARIEEYLALDPEFECWNVRARARYGDVALTGRIWTKHQERRLEEIVRHIEGVRRVAVDLRPGAPSLWN